MFILQPPVTLPTGELTNQPSGLPVLPVPVLQPAVQRRSAEDEIRSYLSNESTGNNGTNNPGILRPLRTSDQFISSMHNGNRDIVGGENFIQGAQALGLYGRAGQTAANAGRFATGIRVASRYSPWLAPFSGYLAYTDWCSDYNNAYGTTTITDELGQGEIDNSLFDVREHARINNITLTRDQEIIRANQLRSQRARNFYINTACTGGGAVVGTVWGAAALGTVIGSFIPIPVVGSVLGFLGGAAVGLCLGAGIGNLAGSAVKGICNFFGGLFSGRARRGGYS